MLNASAACSTRAGMELDGGGLGLGRFIVVFSSCGRCIACPWNLGQCGGQERCIIGAVDVA
eukprot:6208744-Lingulodinium_polyedra.AAC.1